MRRIAMVLAVVISIALIAAGCGAKSAEQVVKDLDHVVSKLDSYEGMGKMTLYTGQQEQTYSVEVWYQNPHYYRIKLSNEQNDISQIVLRNDEGVFILTPHLNKMFRFQSDWPENSGQVYLFQSLAQSILMDADRVFTEEKDSYIFDVVANYQNGMLSRQKVWLDKKTYAPQQVQVTDDNHNVVVAVSFSHFQFGKKFDKDSFDMQRNMTSWNLETMPTSTGVQGTPQGNAGGEQQANHQTFGIIEPEYTPEGVTLQDLREITLGGEKAVLLRYSGKYNYTIVESMPETKTVTSLAGTILDLGYTLGIVTGEEKGMRTLTWTYNGVEFRLSTGDLHQEEMIKIAQSVQGQIGK